MCHSNGWCSHDWGNQKLATHDMHMFCMNPKWTRILFVWGNPGVVTVGKDSKTDDKGVVGYREWESDGIRMWDLYTMRIIPTWDVILLKCLHFQQVNTAGVLDLNDMSDATEIPWRHDVCNNTHTTETGMQCQMEWHCDCDWTHNKWSHMIGTNY
jgi:hypothetical protein